MNETPGPQCPRFRTARWLLWGGFAIAWTFALLTTFPLLARDALMPEETGLRAGKLLHVAAYTLFTALTALLDVSPGRRWFLLGLVSLHGAGTEFLQQFVDRTPSWVDVGLNHLGIVLGVGLTWWRWEGVRRLRP